MAGGNLASTNLCNPIRKRLPDRISSVAGVQPPAFVERGYAELQDATSFEVRVAGVQPPAFVERSYES